MSNHYLEVISSLSMVGGAENFAISFAKYLSKKEELTIVTLYKDGNAGLIKKLHDIPNVTIIHLNKRKHIDLRTAVALRKIIKSKKIDYVHSENNCLLTLFLAIFPIKNRPLVLHTLHLPGPKECPTRRQQAVYTKIFHTKGFYPIALSASLAREAQAFYRLQHVRNIPNGIDSERFVSSCPLEKRPNDVVILARFTPQKNYSFVLSVFERIQTLNPHITCSIYGQGEEEDFIRNAILEKKLLNVRMMGITQEPEKVLASTKVFFLGSSYEANPMSINEAMACGCVVVASAVNGVPEIVENGKTGFLFDLSSPDAFARRIVEICENPALFRSISLAAIEAAKFRSFDIVVASYLEAFSEITKSSC